MTHDDRPLGNVAGDFGCLRGIGSAIATGSASSVVSPTDGGDPARARVAHRLEGAAPPAPHPAATK
jgi:hypothetical protein